MPTNSAASQAKAHRHAPQPLDVMSFNMGQPSLIEASAGTGKTYTITNLVLRALLGVGKPGTTLERPLQLDEMLIVTFTNAATADLRRRVYNRIREARVYFESFLDFSLDYMLQLLHTQGVSDEAAAVLWEQKSARSKVQALIVRQRQQWEAQAADEAGAVAGATEAGAHDDFYLMSHCSDEELDQLFVEFRVNELLALAKQQQVLSSDLVLEEILRELLERTSLLAQAEVSTGPKVTSVGTDLVEGQARSRTMAASFLRKAIQVLLNAERTINTASICTIHSFCNQALTQNYSLESGEPFNTELKIDAQQEIHQACYAVWRRLFYQHHSSANFLGELLVSGRDQGVDGPISFYEKVGELNKVRLSDSHEGFYGYQLLGIKELLKDCQCHLDQNQELEPQLLAYIAWFDHMIEQLYHDLVVAGNAFSKAHHQEELAQLYDFAQGKFGPEILALNAKVSPSVKTVEYLQSIADFYSYLEQVQTEQLHLQQLKKQAVELGLLENEQADLSLTDNNFVATTNEAKVLVGSLQQQQLTVQHTLTLLFTEAQNLWQNKEVALFKGTGGRNAEKANEEKAKAVQPLADFIAALTSKLALVLEDKLTILNKVTSLLRTLVAIVVNEEYARTCKDQHVMDTDEVLKRLDYALNARGELGERLAWSLQARYPLAMIDEFQDTDPVQFNIFAKIYLNEKAVDRHVYCYLIGDPKQSIYAFRGSDINSYIKAKQRIEKLTHGNGVYTLDTNYRSSPDIVYANNALFETWFNQDNVNPFNDDYISFSPVNSKLEKQQQMRQAAAKATDAVKAAPAVKGKGKGKGKVTPDAVGDAATDTSLAGKAVKPDFVWNEVDAFIARPQDAVVEEVLAEKPRAVPSFAPQAQAQPEPQVAETQSLEAETEATASASKKDVTTDGRFLGASAQGHTYIVNVGMQKNKGDLDKCYAKSMAQLVKSLLDHGWLKERKVRSGDIAILVRSVTENNLVQNALKELHIQSVYYSDGSSVLSDGNNGPSEESSELIYLMEAMCDCTNRLKLSRVLGSRLLSLSTAEFKEKLLDQNFEQEVQILSKCAQTWAKYGFLPAFLQWDELHHMGESLLKLNDGERLYTNYCHISEIIQTVHQQKTSINAQLHWFYELVYQNQAIFNQDTTTKRLASEQDQIKIMTMHKSKGLEFPIVLMPFVWSTKKEYPVVNDYFKVCKYYDAGVEHIVLDFETERSLQSGAGQQLTVQEQSKKDERCEQMRLLYVTVTRAKYANFFFVGENTSTRNKGKATALPQMHGKSISESEKNDDPSLFLAAATNYPQLFTILDGQKLLEPETAASHASHASNASKPVATGSDGSEKEPSYAMSFLYQDAIKRNFNIFSYTSLVVGSQDTVNVPRWADGTANTMQESETEVSLHEGADDSYWTETTALSEQKRDPVQMPIPLAAAFAHEPYGIGDENYSLAAVMESAWAKGLFFMKNELLQRQGSIASMFPRGTTPGSFIHEVLQEVEFERVKESGWSDYLVANTIEAISAKLGYQQMLNLLSVSLHAAQEQAGNFKQRLGEWFNDVLEAPMVQGRYHCLALADLHPQSYEREMEFLMSCQDVSTKDIDSLCQHVAKSLLSPQVQQEFLPKMHLTHSELVGFCKGSIDLACRFDVNERLSLRLRPDLVKELPQDDVRKVQSNIASLQQLFDSPASKKAASKLPAFVAQDGEINPACCKGAESTADVKYYVVDYKTNYLGNDCQDYDYDALLASIYDHRYDVQFLIYTLALYRFLKRRMGVSFAASEQELREFYDQHIGGVVYLYLRGMKANYLRDHLSTGVFSTKIDFAVIYKLDHIFAGEQLGEK